MAVIRTVPRIISLLMWYLHYFLAVEFSVDTVSFFSNILDLFMIHDDFELSGVLWTITQGFCLNFSEFCYDILTFVSSFHEVKECFDAKTFRRCADPVNNVDGLLDVEV